MKLAWEGSAHGGNTQIARCLYKVRFSKSEATPTPVSTDES